jgi:hypothetical protein
LQQSAGNTFEPVGVVPEEVKPGGFSSLAASPEAHANRFGRKDFLPVEPQGGLSFLILLSEPRFA